MTSSLHSQRGEGKLGCIVMLLLFALGGAIAVKVGPVYYSNMELKDKADLVASMGSRVPGEQVDAELRAKAKELEIPEALKPGAIQVTKTSNGETGNCRIRLRYTRKIDFWGFYTLSIKTEETIDKVIFTNI